MTENTEEKKEKKLTFGANKLSLSSKSIYPKMVSRNLGGSSSVVVEVKRGKATGGDLTLSRESTSLQSNQEMASRRLAALQRSIDEEGQEEAPLSTLSRLAEINQSSEIKDAQEHEALLNTSGEAGIDSRKEKIDTQTI